MLAHAARRRGGELLPARDLPPHAVETRITMTATAAEYVVLPAARGWVVRCASGEESEGFADKGDAVGRAFALARRSREWRVVVLARDGKVETELYGLTEAIRMSPPSSLFSS